MSGLNVGFTGIIELLPRVSKRVGQAALTLRRFDCPNEEVDSFLASFGEVSFDIEPLDSAPRTILTIETETQPPSESQPLSDVWEAAYNENQLSLWAAPNVITEMDKLSIETAAQVRADIESILSGNRTYTDTDGSEKSLTFEGIYALLEENDVDTTVIKQLVAENNRGVDSWIESTSVLRRVLTLPANNQLAPVFQNINAIYSTVGLLSFEATIPINLRSAIQANSSLMAGWWLRKAPNAAQQSDGKWIYTVEYWFTPKYSEFVYTRVA